MDVALMTPGMLALVSAALGLGIGAFIASRLARRTRRTLERDLARRELDLLDARAIARADGDGPQDRSRAVLELALRKLQLAQHRIARLDGVLNAQERRHESRLRTLAADAGRARRQARSAVRIARTAAAHLKRLEAASKVTQTITARDPKSYGAGDAHTVSVVDQQTLEARRQVAARVSHRDSARLATLRPSNESAARMPATLHAIEGMTDTLARRLQAAGIRDAEQLAALSDHEADALDLGLRTNVDEAALAKRLVRRQRNDAVRASVRRDPVSHNGSGSAPNA